MWIVLLVKLLTPPLVAVPIGVHCFHIDYHLAQRLFVVWISGTCVMTALFLHQLWSYQAMLRAGRVTSLSATRELEEIAQRMGIRNVPQIQLFDGRLSPLLWGWGFQSVIVFPQTLWERLGPQERRSLLIHELGHHVRGDHYVRVLEIVCLCLYWWHPVVWCARRRIEESEEACCDAFVIRHESSRTYANAIMATLDFMSEREPVSSLAMASQLAPISLQKRLTAVMLRSQSECLSHTGWLTLVAFCVILLPMHFVIF